jgi:hypothetical protein
MEKSIKSWGFMENRGYFMYKFVNLVEILLQSRLLLARGGRRFRGKAGWIMKNKKKSLAKTPRSKVFLGPKLRLGTKSAQSLALRPRLDLRLPKQSLG